jgi:hypothetical protein
LSFCTGRFTENPVLGFQQRFSDFRWKKAARTFYKREKIKREHNNNWPNAITIEKNAFNLKAISRREIMCGHGHTRRSGI